MTTKIISGPYEKILMAYLILDGNHVYIVNDEGNWWQFEAAEKADEHFAGMPKGTFELSEAKDGTLSWRMINGK